MWFITSATAETAHGAAHEVADHGAKTFPPFDATNFSSQLFWLAVTFGLLYWLMSRVALPRIADIISTRQHLIEEDVAAARAAHDEAQAAEEAQAKKLAQARAHAQTEAQAARERQEAQTNAARKDLEAALQEKINAAEAQIMAARAKAMSNVSQIVSETASEIFHQVTGDRPDPQRLAATVAQVVKG